MFALTDVCENHVWLQLYAKSSFSSPGPVRVQWCSLAPLLALLDTLSPFSVLAHVMAQSYIMLYASDLSWQEIRQSFLKFLKL